MRRILATAAVLTSLTAHAKVVKPPNTINDAKGTTTIEGVQFTYTVNDRGWLTSAHIEDGKTTIHTQKSFLLIFETQKESTVGLSDTITKSIEQDAAEKCNELGNLEYPNQVKAIPPTMKSSLKNEIVNGRSQIISQTSAWGTYVCLVQIDASDK